MFVFVLECGKKSSRNQLFAVFVPKNDTKRRTHPVLCSVDVPLTFRYSIQRDTVRIAATVAVHFEFGSSFFQDCIYCSTLFSFCQEFFSFLLYGRNRRRKIPFPLGGFYILLFFFLFFYGKRQISCISTCDKGEQNTR